MLRDQVVSDLWRFGGVFAVTAFAFGVIGLAGAVLTRRLWAPVPVLAWAYAMGAVGVAGWATFVAYWLYLPLGPFVPPALVVAALVIAIWGRAWRWLGRAAPVLGLGVGTLMAYFGYLFMWGGVKGKDFFEFAGLRFARPTWGSDNYLPTLVAQVIAKGGDPSGFHSYWNIGDRPTLQAGIILLVHSVVPTATAPTEITGLAVSIVAQLLWIPAVVVILRVIGFSLRTTLVTVVFTAATATMLRNSTYTWPKLLSAGFVLVSLAILIAAVQRRIPVAGALPAAGGLFALSMLSHGVAAFTVPAVLVFSVILLWRSRRSGALRAMAFAAATVVLVYVPWMLYQRFASPPGNRLLKWQLAGFTPVDDRGFLRTLIDQYRAVGLHGAIENRLADLPQIFNPHIIPTFHTSVVGIQAHRMNEFLNTSVALSWGAFAIVLVLVIAGIHWVRTRTITVERAWVAALWALMLLCMAFWVALIFQSGQTQVHQGSHAWLILFIAGSFAWLYSYSRVVGWLFIGGQVFTTLWYYTKDYYQPSGLLIGPLVIALIGVAVVGGTLALTSRVSDRALETFIIHSGVRGLRRVPVSAKENQASV